MRICLLILFQLVTLCSIGQTLLDQEISISFKKLSLAKALNKLEVEHGQNFSYNSRQITVVEKDIDGSFDQTYLSEILDFLFNGTNLQYKEIGGQISIYPVTSSNGSVVLSGYIRDDESKEELYGAKLYFPQLGFGCISNHYGYYAIEIPKGETSMYVSFIGMERYMDTVNFEQDVVMNFNLKSNSTLLHAVEIKQDSIRLNDIPINLSNPDRTTITKQAVLEIPSVAGEPDLIKCLQQFPGVQPTEDGGANFQIRGSGPGNNLILIDEIPVYHPTHMLGVFSIVNVEAIKSATLYKDYIPLKFGGKSSSVLQIHTNEGNLEKTHFSGGLSAGGGRLNLEGPIVRHKASYYFSVRKSFFPRIAFNLFNNSNFTLPNYHDFNGKINVHLNSNNRIYFTGYYGRDRLRDAGLLYRWGNTAGAFRWNHIWNSKTFSNFSFTHSQFNHGYETSTFIDLNGNDPLPFESHSQVVIQDKIRYDVTNFYSNSLKLEFGFDLSWMQTEKAKAGDISTNLFLERSAFENGFYLSAEKKFGNGLTVTGGIRTPFSFHFGKQDTVSYLNSDLSYTEVIYKKNKAYDLFLNVDPRILLNYKVGKKDQLSFAAGIASQNTHLINYQYNFLPVGIWTTSNAFLKPERNHSSSIGWVHQEKIVEFSTSIYGKYVRNVIDYALPVVTSSQEIESNLLSGRLFAYGVEFQLNFDPAKWYSATVSYTYSRTDQKVAGINNNQSYVALNDRPHAVNFSQLFNIKNRWLFATNYIYHSGRALTIPSGQFLMGGTAFPVFSEKRNSDRLPYFSRLDVSVTRKLGAKRKRVWGELILNVTNVLGRYNPSVVYIDPQTIGTSNLGVVSKDYSPTTVVLSFNFKI